MDIEFGLFGRGKGDNVGGSIDCQKGFTLLETMIALVIFSIGVLGVGALQVKSMGMNAFAGRATCDAAAVADWLERIRSLPYDDSLLTDTDNCFDPSHPDHGPFEIASTASTIEWEIGTLSPVDHVKRVGITLRYAGANGGRKQYTWSCLVARNQ